MSGPTRPGVDLLDANGTMEWREEWRTKKLKSSLSARAKPGWR